MGISAKRFTQLRAWEACDIYKQAVLRICRGGTLAKDFELRNQLEGSACGPTDHLAEGFGRFNPPDFARYAVFARASLMESQNQLLTAVQKGHIAEERRIELNRLAETALEETTGLLEYLQSAEALKNAQRIRERRDARRARRRRHGRGGELQTSEARSTEPRTAEPSTPNPEPRTEPGTGTRTGNRER